MTDARRLIMLDDYEKTRPRNEQRIGVLDSTGRLVAITRVAYVNGVVRVVVHSVAPDGAEQLPLAYMLGSNALDYKVQS